MNELDIENVLSHIYKSVFANQDYDMHKQHLMGILFDELQVVMTASKTTEQAQSHAKIIIMKWCRQCSEESITLNPQTNL